MESLSIRGIFLVTIWGVIPGNCESVRLHGQAMVTHLRRPSFVMTGSQVRILFAAPKYTFKSNSWLNEALYLRSAFCVLQSYYGS